MFYPYIKEGGFVWMLPIVFLCFVAMAFCFERFWYWLVYFYETRHRKKILHDFFRVPFDHPRALQTCAHSKDPVLIALKEFLMSYAEMKLEIAERKAAKLAEEIVEASRQFYDWLAMIANISGTLGLFGTVIGISMTFKSMVSDDPKGMALSLSTALYTTDAGIILFFLAYLCLFLFQKFSTRLETDLETYLLKLKNTLQHEEASQMVFDPPKQDEKEMALDTPKNEPEKQKVIDIKE